jgi:hypothetical protein
MNYPRKRVLIVAESAAIIAVVLLICLYQRYRRPADSSAPLLISDARETRETVHEYPQASVPNIFAGEDADTPYPVVADDEYSPTTLSDADVCQEVAETLEGLMRLEPTAIEKVSQRTIGGDHNPFRYMLQVAAENNIIGDAFRHLATASEFEIMRFEVSDGVPNAYTFYISCSTPYVADLLSVLSAGTEPKYIQEVSLFAGSGAAAVLSKMDLGELPVSTDIIELTVVVENDVSMIYHPVSLNHGNRMPQYAFLWGGAVFCGILDGDLLIENTLGHSLEVERDRFLSVETNAQAFEFIDSALSMLRLNDFEAIAGLRLHDKGIKISSEGFDDSTSRTVSLEYSYRFFGFKRSLEDYVPYNTLMITYSVAEPDCGGRVRFYHFVSWSSLNEMDRTMIVEGVSDMMAAIVGSRRSR